MEEDVVRVAVLLNIHQGAGCQHCNYIKPAQLGRLLLKCWYG